MADIISAGTGPTMSSVEIANLCDKRHDNVMRDTRHMLVELHGEGGLLKFEDTYRNDQNGQVYPCFKLPKRESLILVSGYDVHLRARIIDRWQELEAKPKPVSRAPRIDTNREHRLTLSQNMKLAKMMGLDGNQAAFAANKATRALTGIDTLGLMEITFAPAPQNEKLLAPSDIGGRAGGLSGRRVNDILIELGLQERFRDHKQVAYYEPTEAGKLAGGQMVDTERKHSDGAPVRQLRWASSVANLIRDHLGSG